MQLDLIVRAREIITMDPDRPIASVVGVIGDRIVGFDDEVAGIEAIRTLDFADACVTPGLIDAHCHTVWWGLGLAAIDLSRAASLEDLYRLIETEVERIGDDADAWVHGTGFNQGH
ncbi:hypothetical protein ACIQYM_36190, partial [Rhodococcus erythropolis]